MDLFLGIDGGGTGCRAVLAEGSGQALAHAEAGPANIATDFDGALASILTASRQACAKAGLDLDSPAMTGRLAAGLGLAGANAAGLEERLRAALPFARIAVETDAATALRGALGQSDGIVAALGTGSVYARRMGGVIRQIGGWGLTLGDSASGAWIGREILTACLMAEDGFQPWTPLLQDLSQDFGGAQGIIAFSLRARPGDLARLAPRVVDSADPAARALMARAEAEVIRAIDLLQDGRALPVVFLGGLGGVFTPRLAGRWRIVPPQGNALDGALQLALSLRKRAA